MSENTKQTYCIDSEVYKEYHNFTSVVKAFKMEAVPVPETQVWLDKNDVNGGIKTYDQIIKYAKLAREVVIAYYFDTFFDSVKMDSSVITKLVSMVSTGENKRTIEKVASSCWESIHNTIKCGFTTNAEMWNFICNGLNDEGVLKLLLPYCSKFDNCTVDELYAKLKYACNYIVENKKLSMSVFKDEFTSVSFIFSIGEKVSFKVGSVGYRALVENVMVFANNSAIFGSNTELANDLVDFIGIDMSFVSNTFNYKISQSYVDNYNKLVATVNQRINEYNQANKTKLSNLKRMGKLPSSADSCVTECNNILNDGGLVDVVHKIEHTISAVEPKVNAMLDIMKNESSSIYMACKKERLSYILGCESKTTISSLYKEYVLSENPRYPAETSKKYTARIKELNEQPCSISIVSTLLGIDASAKLAAILSDNLSRCKEGIAKVNNSINGTFGTTKVIPTLDDVKVLLQEMSSEACALRRNVNMFYFDDTPLAEHFEFHQYVSDIVSEVESIPHMTNLIRSYVTTNTLNGRRYVYTADRVGFMSGLSETKCKENGNFLFRIDNDMYIGVAPYGSNIDINDMLIDKNSTCKFYASMKWDAIKQLPKKYLAKSYVVDGKNWITDEIKLYASMATKDDRDGYSASNPDFFTRLINYYKECLMHDNYDISSYKDGTEYSSIKDFAKEVNEVILYKEYKNVDFSKLMTHVKNGSMYLYKITCRDMKTTHKGKLNNSVLWFYAATDPSTMNDARIQLSFGRTGFNLVEAETTDMYATHPAGTFVKNKTNEGGRTFKYDLFKDRSKYRNKYTVTFTITLNKDVKNASALNDQVMYDIEHGKFTHVIGLDRGERNLVHLTVKELKTSKIVYTKSLNVVNGVDYRQLLDDVNNADKRKQKTWGTRQRCDKLMAGFCSYAVHEVVYLALKYNAVIAMENLTNAFCKQRKSMCRYSVYSMFRNALIKKLNAMYCDKNDFSSVLNAYQFTNGETKDELNRKQNGIIFYVDPSYTSNNDVTTGFITNFITAKYDTNEQARETIDQFDSISFDKDMNAIVINRDGIDMYMKGPRMIYANKMKTETSLEKLQKQFARI